MAALALAALLLLQDEVALGNKAYQEGRYAEAADHFEKALASDQEKTVPLWIAFGNASAQAGRWEQAIRGYQGAIALRANTADLHRSLGQVLAAAGRTEEAIASLRRAESMDPDGPDSLSIARIRVQREEWLQAEMELSFYLRAAPSSIDGLELFSYVLARQGKNAEAGAIYRALSRLKPGEGKYLAAWARAEAGQRRYAEAIDILEIAVRLGVAEVDALRLLADLYLQQEMHREAAAAYVRMLAAAREPKSDDYFRLGHAYLRTGETASARAAFEKARSLDPSNAAASLQLGAIAASRGEADLARKEYAAAAKAGPAPAASEALGEFELQQGRFPEAAAAFTEALKRGGSGAGVRYGLAFALYSAGKIDDARAAVREALHSAPLDDRLRGLLRQIEK